MNQHFDPWAALETDIPEKPDDGYLRRRMHLKSSLDVFFALSFPERMPAILLEMSPSFIYEQMEIFDCRGFQFKVLSWDSANGKRILLLLLLADRQFRDVFAIMTEEIRLALDNVSGERIAVLRLTKILHHWREFFYRYSDSPLTKEEQQGLFGELWFFKNELLSRLTTQIAISAWTGPDGAHQDFQTASVAIEVKTSRMLPPETVTIANILQLDYTSLPALLLYHLSLDPRQDGEYGLVDMIQDLRLSLGKDHSACVTEFNIRLFRTGYRDADALKYSTTRFKIRHSDIYRVGPGFPCLRERDLPLGVGNVSYSIAIAACFDHKITDDEFETLLNRGHHE